MFLLCLVCFGGVLVCPGLHMYINIYIHMHLHIKVHSNPTDEHPLPTVFFSVFSIILISVGLIGRGLTMCPFSQSNVAVQSIFTWEKVRRLKENIPN